MSSSRRWGLVMMRGAGGALGAGGLGAGGLGGGGLGAGGLGAAPPPRLLGMLILLLSWDAWTQITTMGCWALVYYCALVHYMKHEILEQLEPKVDGVGDASTSLSTSRVGTWLTCAMVCWNLS